MNGLHLRAISHSFGKNMILDDVSVFVAPGELVCLLGPSGCGKTTLLRLAAGLEALQTGEVEINGKIVAEGSTGFQLPPEQRDIGLMFQDYALFPHLNVRDNVSFGIEKKHHSKRQTIVAEGMSSMGVSGYADAFPHTLSGGQQQRVALLRALAPGPKILLLDEPFSGLDVARRAQVRTETLRTIKDAGVGTLMVTHDPEEAMFMADRILVMNKGHVVQDGTPTELYFKPKSPFVAELFGTANAFSGIVGSGQIQTPIGNFPANGHIDGTKLRILIRPEDIQISESGEGLLAKVITARPLGPSSVILLALDDGTALEARAPGAVLPEKGSTITISVHQDQIHLFPNDKTR